MSIIMSFHISFTLLSGYMIKPVFDIKMEDAYQAGFEYPYYDVLCPGFGYLKEGKNRKKKC